MKKAFVSLTFASDLCGALAFAWLGYSVLPKSSAMALATWLISALCVVFGVVELVRPTWSEPFFLSNRRLRWAVPAVAMTLLIVALATGHATVTMALFAMFIFMRSAANLLWKSNN